MGRSVIIGIQRDTAGMLAARLFQAPVNYPGGLDPAGLILPIPMPDCDTESNVRSYGQAVYAALTKHPGIAAEINRLSLGNAATMDGLQFRIETPVGEQVRWETLYGMQAEFLALNPGCRITRLATTTANSDAGARTYQLPLRMLAFLSASNVPATNELKALRTQIDALRALGIAIEAVIYLGEQPLLQEMQATLEPGYDFRAMPDSADALKAQIKSQQAQFVHMFGHGIVASGVSALEFATIADNLLGEANGSVILAVDGLVDALEAQKSSWLTVLNSCSGAKAAERLNSMAFKVAERGSPYAVGMHEPIDAGVANSFTTTFYREIFSIVERELKTAPTGSVELDFSPAIVPVRQHFFATYQVAPPEAYGTWSLPVMYQNPSPLRATFLEGAIDPATKARIDYVAGLLRKLPATTEASVREEIRNVLAVIPPPVPRALWPDLSGQFPLTANGVVAPAPAPLGAG